MNTSKKNSFFPIGSVSSALMCSTATGDKPGPPARGAFSSEEDKDKQKEVAQSKSQQQASPSHVLEEFFWIGNSIMAFSKWRLGYMGKLSDTPSRVLVGCRRCLRTKHTSLTFNFTLLFVYFVFLCNWSATQSYLT